MQQTHRLGVQLGEGPDLRGGGQIGRGGPDRGGGARSGEGVQVKELLSNTFFVLAVCWGKIISNFLEGGGGQIGGGCRIHFNVLEFLGRKNYLKFSRNTF